MALYVSFYNVLLVKMMVNKPIALSVICLSVVLCFSGIYWTTAESQNTSRASLSPTDGATYTENLSPSPSNSETGDQFQSGANTERKSPSPSDLNQEPADIPPDYLDAGTIPPQPSPQDGTETGSRLPLPADTPSYDRPQANVTEPASPLLSPEQIRDITMVY